MWIRPTVSEKESDRVIELPLGVEIETRVLPRPRPCEATAGSGKFLDFLGLASSTPIP